jgi:hypothetical protein
MCTYKDERSIRVLYYPHPTCSTCAGAESRTRTHVVQRLQEKSANVLFYFYNFDRTPPTRSGISMFPVLPTIGVDVTF